METIFKEVSMHGAALVSNTMVCEISRLLSGKDENLRQSSWNITEDLISFVEAATLHDNLFTLPATLSSDVADLTFRNDLISNGILHELDTSKFHKRIGDSILQLVEAVGIQKEHYREEGENYGETFKKVAEGVIKPDEKIILKSSHPANSSSILQNRTSISENDIPLFYVGKDLIDDLHEPSYRFRHIGGESLVDDIVKRDSGGYWLPQNRLRDMYYIFTSEEMSLPYWAEDSKIEFARNFPSYFNNSFRIQLYRKLAEALNSTVPEIFDDLRDDIAFVPPFSALVFERSNSLKDVPEQIFIVRNEYTKLRENFTKLETERSNTQSIKQRRKIRTQQKKLLEMAARKFENPSRIKLENVIRYIPKVIEPMLSPTDLTKYNSELLLKPIELIVDWWQSRPLQQIFALKDKFENIEDYYKLKEKLFGTAL